MYERSYLGTYMGVCSSVAYYVVCTVGLLVQSCTSMYYVVELYQGMVVGNSYWGFTNYSKLQFYFPEFPHEPLHRSKALNE